MEKPRYEWTYSTDREEWPFEIYDHEEARVVARCETKDDVKFLHSLLADDEAKYTVRYEGAFGSVIVTKPVIW